ncbi:hypothetical protein [Natrinema salaciae]|nr:hypothetical protein [Natrinema salaciae]
MTEHLPRDGREGRSDSERADRSSSRSHDAERTPGPPRRVMTDGGQAEMDESDAEDAPEGDEDAAPADEAEVEDEAADEEPEETAESEAEDEEPEEAAESEAEDEYHVEDAEDVYQDDEASGVLHLDLDGLYLDLLGLEVNLNPVTLDVSARPGGNKLLGNLLSAVTGLLDGPGAMLDSVKSLLGKPKEMLGTLLGKPKAMLSNLLSKPGEWLSGLFGGGAAEGETDADEGGPADEEADEAEPSEERESPGRISRAGSWLKEKLSGLVPSIPTEEIVAMIVREVIEQLVERLEPKGEEEPGEQAEPSQAEASS